LISSGGTTDNLDRIIATAQQAQHPDGGFGGGPGQYAHSATSYAMVLALINAGGEEALKTINRKQMWHWLGRMKQKNGGFTVCAGGEEDIRYAMSGFHCLCPFC
jgi:protein farnesyltransferase subunit beta